jgi:FkbM family methyltransferase
MASSVRIGSHEITVPDDHIYTKADLPPSYDFVPWNLVSTILGEVGWQHSSLIDIGANVGDSLAHFRRSSKAAAFCIEPDTAYFEMLTQNAKVLGNVNLRRALVVPVNLVGKTTFGSDGQTGWSRAAGEHDEVWEGEYLTASEVLEWAKNPSIIKTDTDGFDAEILKALIPSLGRYFVPLILFEGPLEKQHINQSYQNFIEACDALMGVGYKLLLLTNLGMPYSYVGTDSAALRASFHALTIAHHQNRAPCHYFDVIALHQGLASETHCISEPWPDAIFTTR